MALTLDIPPEKYDRVDQAQSRKAISDADKQNIKTGQILDKLLFRDTVTGTIKTIVVTSGAFVIT